MAGQLNFYLNCLIVLSRIFFGDRVGSSTDVASFAPKAKAAAVVTAKGMLGAEISYNEGKQFMQK